MGITMSDEQPHYFTVFDCFWELFHVGLISSGCYAGWMLTNSVLGLFAGGIAGRIVGFCIVLSLRSLMKREAE
jgi:hypothetical protein